MPPSSIESKCDSFPPVSSNIERNKYLTQEMNQSRSRQSATLSNNLLNRTTSSIRVYRSVNNKSISICLCHRYQPKHMSCEGVVKWRCWSVIVITHQLDYSIFPTQCTMLCFDARLLFECDLYVGIFAPSWLQSHASFWWLCIPPLLTIQTNCNDVPS